jgi:murein DD-endopeptidase MepM/ murein hydrolase activator NlpD
MKWPFVDPKTREPRLAKPSDDYFTVRGYQPSTYNPHQRHFGIDVPVPEGTLVIAPFACTVTFAGSYGDLGKHVRIVDGYGREWGFSHLSVIGASVKVGAKFKAGQVIARTGNTGRSTGPHCHVHRTTRKITGAWGSQPYESPRPELMTAYKAASSR